MFKRAMMLGMIVTLSLATGCTTVQKWAAGGAVVGAGVGAWAGEVGTGLSTAQAAMVGASGGGLLGALVGDAIDEAETGDLRNQISERDNQIGELQSRYNDAQTELGRLRSELEARNREIERLRNQPAGGIGEQARITIAADVLFRPGSAQISDQGKTQLDSAIQQIRGNNNFIMVEGHTDTQPISVSNWRSNWELGAARSLAVLHYLIDNGIAPNRLSAATFSEYQPVGNDMSQNRRAVIVLYDGWRAAEAQRSQAGQ